jgi:hypothetical protein
LSVDNDLLRIQRKDDNQDIESEVLV